MIHKWVPSGVEHGKGWCSCGWPWREIMGQIIPGKTYRVTKALFLSHINDG